MLKAPDPVKAVAVPPDSRFPAQRLQPQYLIDNLPPAAGKAKSAEGKGRTIGAIVAHMHNVRVMWLKAAKAEEIPAQLDRASGPRGKPYAN